ncbi:adenosine receptor A2b-like [Stylophora pistillata]|uniref:adenosine receptor A2b-like n=1 Tax=Stylophora pistillata TaxID=50429 RepID=UPI000C055733|nr:adenosine receptor A2b-like [Stylophora pistillata]
MESCEKSLEVFPTSSEVEELYVIYIVNYVFIGVLCCTTVMFNIVTVHAIIKTSSLSKPLKILLLSLAVSDTCVGLLVEPFYIAIFVKWSRFKNPTCITYLAFLNLTNVFLLASFFGVVAISIDRFLAIYLHLRYQELVSQKRVIVVVILMWLFCAVISSTSIWRSSVVSSQLFFVIGVVCILITTVVYIKIYAVIRRHRNQIHALQQTTTRNESNMNFSSAKKSANGLFFVYLLLLICYVPRGVYFYTKKFNGLNTTSKSLAVYSLTLLFLNSFLNPVIYCWKMRHIRQAIVGTLRNISRRQRNSNTAPSILEASYSKASYQI